MQFDMSPNEVRSFSMGFFRYSLIEGPMQFVRFSDTSRGKNGRLGRFWMHAHDVASLLEQSGTGRQLLDRISDRWAICDDWGDKGLMWIMTVPSGIRIPVAVGKAHFQPVISQGTQARQKDLNQWNERSWSKRGRDSAYWLETDESYGGGGLQYVIPVRTTDGQPNRGIENLIGERRTTATVATNPKLFLRQRLR